MRRLELVLSTLTAVAAVAVAVLLVGREWGRPVIGAAPQAAVASARVADSLWSDLRGVSQSYSSDSGLSTIVVLSDYECPACRAFHARLADLERELPGEFNVRFVHMPLEYHRFAAPAARVAECAAEVGRFREMSDVLFAAQDSIGMIAWPELARRAGVPDAAEIEDCARASSDNQRFLHIERGIELARRLRAEGTPTVIVEGVLYSRPPSLETIVSHRASAR